MTRSKSKRSTETDVPRADAAPASQSVGGVEGDLRLDSVLMSLATGLGTNIDPLKQIEINVDGFYGRELTQLQVDALMTEWGPAKFIEEVPNDAVRKGVEITVEGDPEAARVIKDRLEELDAMEHLRQALIWERAYGGAILVPSMAAGQTPSEPLQRDKKTGRITTEITEIRRLTALSRYKFNEPAVSDLDPDPKSEGYGLPLRWRPIYNTEIPGIETKVSAETGIHRDRVWVWWGWYPGERLRRYDWGWSLLVPFIDPWKGYGSASRSVMGLAQRANETRYAMEKLRDLIAGGKHEEVRRYMQEVHLMRSAYRVFIHDKNDEIEDVAIQLGGAADIVKLSREEVAAASGMSVSRFFGLQHQGMSDNDETGAQRDEAEVARYQRRKLQAAMNWLVELVVAEQKLAVDSWQVTWPPLREETPKEKADRLQIEATTAQTHHGMGAVHESEIRSGLRASGEVPYQFDDDLDEVGEIQAENEFLLEQIEKLGEQLRAAGIEPGAPPAPRPAPAGTEERKESTPAAGNQPPPASSSGEEEDEEEEDDDES